MYSVEAQQRGPIVSDPTPIRVDLHAGSARPPEVIGYVLAATALCAVVASPVLLGVLSIEYAGVIVPLAQLTPTLIALIFWAVLRPGRLSAALALRWSWRGVGWGLAAVAVVSALQFLLGLTLGWQIRGSDLILTAAIAVLPLLLLQSVFAIGEEFGWRGWLASRTASWPFWTAALAGSLAWVMWHLPALPIVTAGGGWQAGLAYLASIASWAPFLLALRRRTGSVWAAVITHGALNSLRVFFLQSIADAGGADWAVEAIGWLLWLGAAWLLMRRTSDTASRDAH
ncbi:CPBP family intramembrane metalloprotease [Parenemella sanctibonifatiensis]|uniref:CPBP family intramembrane metalloprotease n=1 Tax=Parenemella sanctibonifatiensis TaxID=2016505 RepID=A0A255EHQ2_9ACTN|nr:CPBP family intramembrane metalloprotease [Parenemella sanctibonifatiensis]